MGVPGLLTLFITTLHTIGVAQLKVCRRSEAIAESDEVKQLQIPTKCSAVAHCNITEMIVMKSVSSSSQAA